MRKLAGLEPISRSGVMEVIWFRLPGKADDPLEEAALHLRPKHIAVVLGRSQAWQIGYVVGKGGYQRLKTEGVPAFRQSIAASLPWLADRVESLPTGRGSTCCRSRPAAWPAGTVPACC